MRTSVLASAIVLLASSAAHAGGPAAFDVQADLESGDFGDVETAIDKSEITATASSTLCEKKPKLCHDAAALVDGKMETAWCEGAAGDGKGESITLTFAKPEKIANMFLVPHFAKSFALAEQNNRLAKIEITTDAGTVTA